MLSRNLVFSGCVTLLAVLALLSGGCGGYPEVSPRAFELAKLLDNACNVRKADQLEEFRQLVDQATTDQEITSQERGWLLGITETAEAGDWDAAATEARKLLLDQTRPVPPTGKR